MKKYIATHSGVKNEILTEVEVIDRITCNAKYEWEQMSKGSKMNYGNFNYFLKQCIEYDLGEDGRYKLVN